MSGKSKSVLNVLRLMDGRDSDTASRPVTSVELDVKFKMSKHHNPGRSSTPTPSTDDESSSRSSVDTMEQKECDDIIQQRLQRRAYHLPGNNGWCKDLCMYLSNNHLVFGICCHHRLHPLRIKHRLVILVGSLAFGLSATNAVFLYFLWARDDTNHDDAAFSFSIGGDVVENMTEKAEMTIDISHGMALLWTVGAASHAIFDLALWHMVSCWCCTKQKQCRVVGWNVAVALVMLLVALTSFAVVLRAYESVDHDASAYGGDDFDTTFSPDFRYLYGYLVELALSLFVYSTIGQIILFSGVLGCGAVPVLGGRPYEVRKMKSPENGIARDGQAGPQNV